MKVERWQEETDEEWAKRLAYEIKIANDTETTLYFVERDSYDEDSLIINYVGEASMTWKEHPEGPFSCKQVLEWKNKATKWDEVEPMLPKVIEILTEVNDISDALGLGKIQSSTQKVIKEVET